MRIRKAVGNGCMFGILLFSVVIMLSLLNFGEITLAEPNKWIAGAELMLVLYAIVYYIDELWPRRDDR